MVLQYNRGGSVMIYNLYVELRTKGNNLIRKEEIGKIDVLDYKDLTMPLKYVLTSIQLFKTMLKQQDSDIKIREESNKIIIDEELIAEFKLVREDHQ